MNFDLMANSPSRWDLIRQQRTYKNTKHFTIKITKLQAVSEIKLTQHQVASFEIVFS